MSRIKIRPAVLLGIVVLGVLAWHALDLGLDVPGGVAIGGIVGLLPKCIDSEEKGS